MIRDRKKPHKPQSNGNGTAGESKAAPPPNLDNEQSPDEAAHEPGEHQIDAPIDSHVVLLLIILEDLLAEQSLDLREWTPHLEHISRAPGSDYVSGIVDTVLCATRQRRHNGRLAGWLITYLLDRICAYNEESPLPPSDSRALLQVWRKAAGKSAFRTGSKLRLSRRRTPLEKAAARSGAERS